MKSVLFVFFTALFLAGQVMFAQDGVVLPAVNVLWQQSIACSFSSEPILRTGADGSVLVIGETYTKSSLTERMNVLYHVSKEGRQQHVQSNIAPGLWFKDVYACFHSGQWVMAADSVTGSGAVIACYSDRLKRRWQKTFDSTGVYAVATDAQGFTYAVLGSIDQRTGKQVQILDSAEKSYFPFDLACLDDKGKLQWRRTFYLEGFVRSVKILPMDTLLYLAVNTTVLRGPDHHDLQVLQLKKNGALNWRRQLSGASSLGEITARSVVTGPFGQMQIAGIATDRLAYAELAMPSSLNDDRPYSFLLGFDANSSVRFYDEVTVAEDRFHRPVIDLLWFRPYNHLLVYSDAETGDLLVSGDIFSHDQTGKVSRLQKPGYNDVLLFAAAETKGGFYLLKHTDGAAFWDLIKMTQP